MSGTDDERDDGTEEDVTAEAPPPDDATSGTNAASDRDGAVDAGSPAGGSATDDDPADGSPETDERYCSNCGAAIDADSEICPECGVRQQPGQSTDSSESVLAALLSFLIPGLGNFVNGQSERGTVILVLWIAWLILAWGVGFLLIGSLFTLLTLGLGAILQLILGLVLAVVELVIHVLAAVDAYHQSEIVDRVTDRAQSVR